MAERNIPYEVIHTVARNRGMTFQGLVCAIALALLTFLPLALWLSGVSVPGREPGGSNPPPPIAQIQSLSDLATTRVHISDSIEGENDHFQGRWALHGEVVLGVDLSKVRYGRSDREARRVTLILPQPHLVSGKVDHDRSEERSLDAKVPSATWRSSPKSLRDEVWKQADRKIRRLGQEPGYVERAKVQAERVLIRLFEGVGWKVEFEWAT
jgi:hypothetical protein